MAVSQAPIIVRIVEPATDPTGLKDVLVGALGLSGLIALCAVVLGAVLAMLLFALRSRNPLNH
jgi:hypothetical protein